MLLPLCTATTCILRLLLLLQVVQEAICPERRAGLDDKLSAVASVTHVYVSNDLQVRPGPPTSMMRLNVNVSAV